MATPHLAPSQAGTLPSGLEECSGPFAVEHVLPSKSLFSFASSLVTEHSGTPLITVSLS